MSVRVETTLIGSMAAGTELSTAIRAAGVMFMIALTAAAAQISFPIPGTAVPFTLQPMIVILAGAALGSRLGAASQMGYLALGIIGLPIFAASPLLPQGAARLLGPTGGYLMAYPLAAFVTGLLAERGFDRRIGTSIIAMLAGVAVIYAGGLTWLATMHVGDATLAIAAGAAPFLVADLCKAILAAAALPQAWRWLGQPR
ncbi:MAG: biotin transporter BioY [Acidobacteriota bacterium]|nr:biotin transporter BioY [Acidobacteriota bacterium]